MWLEILRGASLGAPAMAFVRVLLLVTAFAVPHAATADTFAAVRYDARDDTLVVTMQYRGTDPNHLFSLKWGRCKRLPGGGGHRCRSDRQSMAGCRAGGLCHDDPVSFERSELPTGKNYAQVGAPVLLHDPSSCESRCVALAPEGRIC